MRKVFLYRPFEADALKDELGSVEAAGFTLVTDRDELMAGDVVLPRFYPFYNYLTDEFAERGVRVLSAAHDWVSDIRNWAPVLSDLTPRTWTSIEDVKVSKYEGPFFVKGIDKSLKIDFKRYCHAEDIDQLPVTLANLRDALPIEQELVIREFIPLRTYGITDAGMPIAHEFRIFVYRGEVLSSGFYWAMAHDGEVATHLPPADFIAEVTSRVGNDVEFYAVDVALTDEGEWIVIELNDGVLSGLSANDPDVLYSRLSRRIDEVFA